MGVKRCACLPLCRQCYTRVASLVLVVGFVWHISEVAHLFLFKLSHNFGVQLGEEFAVFNQNCFTATAICGFFQAEKENLLGKKKW